MKFKTRYNVIGETEGISFTKPTMTQQHFKEECDVNNILKRYVITGVCDHINERQPIFADVSNVGDFMQAQNMILQANEDFMSLPSNVRKRFNNDPALLIDFLNDPASREEAISLGLVNAPVAAEDAPVVE